jgi:hypothetical protein
MMHLRCLSWAACGVLAGCAAYAQDPAASIPLDGGGAFLELVRAGGLPAVLGFIGWMLGRGGVPVTIQLSTVDRELIRRLVKSKPAEPEA